MTVDEGLERDMQLYAISCYPNEACGVIVDVNGKAQFIGCENIHHEPSNNFTVDPLQYSKAADKGQVVAVWHTHIDKSATPSDEDKAGCNHSELPWYIHGITKNHEDVFVFDGPVFLGPQEEVVEYEGRPYLFGIHDCFTLAVDYYRREYGIEIICPDFTREEKIDYIRNNTFVKNYKQMGFVQVFDELENPKVGDVFLMQLADKENPDHIAVYIGNELILHHLIGRLSRRDVFGGYWYKHAIIHLRHEDKC